MCLVSVCVLRFHSLRCEKYSFLLIVKVRISLNYITFHSIEIVFYRVYLSIYAFNSEASLSLFILTGKIKIECKVTAAKPCSLHIFYSIKSSLGDKKAVNFAN